MERTAPDGCIKDLCGTSFSFAKATFLVGGSSTSQVGLQRFTPGTATELKRMY